MRLTMAELGALSWSTPERHERHCAAIKASWERRERRVTASQLRCGHEDAAENAERGAGRCRVCERARRRRRYRAKHPGSTPRVYNSALIGQRFGRLVVTGISTKRKVSKNRLYETRCDCGREWMTYGYLLKRGLTNSCGCLKRELARAKAREQSRDRGRFVRENEKYER